MLLCGLTYQTFIVLDNCSVSAFLSPTTQVYWKLNLSQSDLDTRNSKNNLPTYSIRSNLCFALLSQTLITTDPDICRQPPWRPLCHFYSWKHAYPTLSVTFVLLAAKTVEFHFSWVTSPPMTLCLVSVRLPPCQHVSLALLFLLVEESFHPRSCQVLCYFASVQMLLCCTCN